MKKLGMGVFLIVFFLTRHSPAAEPSRLPTASPTPSATPQTCLGPDLSSLNLSYDEKNFFQKAGGFYYDYRPLGLKEFRCQVDDETWGAFLFFLRIQSAETQSKNNPHQDLKPDPALEKLADVKFYLSYSRNKGFQCEKEGLRKTGNSEYDQKAREVARGVQKETLLFTNAWDFLLGLEKTGKQKQVLKVSKASDGYWLSETIGGQTADWHFNHDGLLTEAVIPPPAKETGTVHLDFSFKKMTGGFLPEKIVFKTEKGGISGEVHMEYEELENFQMPERVKWNCTYPDEKAEEGKGTTGDTMAFYNYEINGVEVDSPLPEEHEPGIDWLYAMQLAFNLAVKAGMEFHVGVGPFLSNSPATQGNYGGNNVDIGVGFEFDPAFSLSLDFQGSDYKNNVTDYYLTYMEVMAVGKYRLFTGDVRPYLLGGLGLSFTEYFPEGQDFTVKSPEDTNLVAEVGGGLEVQVFHSLFLYAQTAYVANPLSSSFAQMAGVESDFHYVPLQFGIAFER